MYQISNKHYCCWTLFIDIQKWSYPSVHDPSPCRVKFSGSQLENWPATCTPEPPLSLSLSAVPSLFHVIVTSSTSSILLISEILMFVFSSGYRITGSTSRTQQEVSLEDCWSLTPSSSSCCFSSPGAPGIRQGEVGSSSRSSRKIPRTFPDDSQYIPSKFPERPHPHSQNPTQKGSQKSSQIESFF